MRAFQPYALTLLVADARAPRTLMCRGGLMRCRRSL